MGRIEILLIIVFSICVVSASSPLLYGILWAQDLSPIRLVSVDPETAQITPIGLPNEFQGLSVVNNAGYLYTTASVYYLLAQNTTSKTNFLVGVNIYSGEIVYTYPLKVPTLYFNNGPQAIAMINASAQVLVYSYSSGQCSITIIDPIFHSDKLLTQFACANNVGAFITYDQTKDVIYASGSSFQNILAIDPTSGKLISNITNTESVHALDWDSVNNTFVGLGASSKNLALELLTFTGSSFQVRSTYPSYTNSPLVATFSQGVRVIYGYFGTHLISIAVDSAKLLDDVVINCASTPGGICPYNLIAEF